MTATDRPVDPDLLLAHAEGLRALAKRLLRDAHRAEDVVQDAMLAAVRRPPPDGVPLGPWLVGVVRNLARMSRRGDARRAARENLRGPHGDEEPADAAVARAETHRRLVDAVLSLAEPYRAAIVMRYLDGLSPSEIARRTGEPSATVRTRVHRGLQLLRERLDVGSRRDGRSWVAAFVVLTRRPRLRVSPLAGLAACLAIAAAGFVALRLDAADVPDSRRNEDVASADGARPDPASERPVTVSRVARPRTRDIVGGVAVEDAAVENASEAVAETEAPAAGPAGVSIEVVDEEGNRLHEGVVKLEPGNPLQLADFDIGKLTDHLHRLGETVIGAANPVVIGDLPRELDGLEVAASARVPGLPPSARVTFVLRAGRTETLKLVVAKPRSAVVRVLDRLTESPIAGASVSSSTETDRRDAASEGAGRAVTGDDGTCLLSGLGGGEHEIVVEAAGYARSRSRWDGAAGDVRVKLVRVKGGATVVVTVTGPDERPFEGIGVEFFGTERVVPTDPAGRAVMSDVELGFVAVSLETAKWFDVCLAAGRKDFGEISRNAVVEAGATVEIALGFPRNTAYIDGRVLAEDGSPLAGVVVHLLGMTGMMSADATTDADGRVRFEHLAGGRYAARLGRTDAAWWAGQIDVATGTRAERTWNLGAHTIRGRVVTGPEHTPVTGASVYVYREGLDGVSVKTGADGRFTVTNARSGTYRFSMQHGDAGAYRFGVVVPSGEEIVLDVAGNGHIAVRYRPEDRADLLAAKLRILAADGEFAGEFADAEGSDDLVSAGLVPGRYDVEVTLGERSRRFSVEVRTGETPVVVISTP